MDFYLSRLPGEVSEDYLKHIFDHIGSVQRIRLLPESTNLNPTMLAIISIELRLRNQFNDH